MIIVTKKIEIMLMPYEYNAQKAILNGANEMLLVDDFMTDIFGITANELFTEKNFDFDRICSISEQIVISQINLWIENCIETEFVDTKKEINQKWIDKIEQIDRKYQNGIINAKEYIEQMGNLIADEK